MYKLGPELGRGGFGTVYSGFRVKDGVTVAIKFVSRENVAAWGTVRKRIRFISIRNFSFGNESTKIDRAYVKQNCYIFCFNYLIRVLSYC